MKLTFTGATGTVTGSQYLIEEGSQKYLVDTGLYQGPESTSKLNRRELPYSPKDINAVFLTHAHIDHSGMIPWLVKNGFRGLIHCTLETLDLCKILLVDSGKIQEGEYSRAKKNNPTTQKPLYTEEEAAQALEQFITHPFYQDINIDNLKVKFVPAGHIPGAASIRIESPLTSLLFSGDLGRYDDQLIHPPGKADPTDYVIMESTYGDRQHDTRDPLEEIGEIVEEIIKRKSVLVVPTFAVARAQLLIHLFKNLFEERPELKIPLFVHSPMTEKVTELYKHFSSALKSDENEMRRWDEFARFIHWKNESESIDRREGPLIIMGASGMISGGRIIDHIEAKSLDPKNIILLTGYQSEETPGRAILEGARQIKVSGKKIVIKAEVRQLKSLSAHADQGQLHQWLDSIGEKPKKVFLSHGEDEARKALFNVLEKDGYTVEIPTLDAAFNLN